MTVFLIEFISVQIVNVYFSDCGTVYKLDHGSVDFSDRDTTYGQSVSVKCEIGYGLQGDSFITCKADGTWSDGPSCVLKSKQCNEYNLSYDVMSGSDITPCIKIEKPQVVNRFSRNVIK